MAGQSIEYPSNGNTATGYLSLPDTGSGPGVIVIQEWWGLVPHIEDVADRFAAEGYVALAPDLYHGQSTTEPDEAQKYMMELRMDEAVRDMTGAVGYSTESRGGGPIEDRMRRVLHGRWAHAIPGIDRSDRRRRTVLRRAGIRAG